MLLRQNHYTNNNSGSLTNGTSNSTNNSSSNNSDNSNNNMNNSRTNTQQRNATIFSNPMKQSQQVGAWGVRRPRCSVHWALAFSYPLHCTTVYTLLHSPSVALPSPDPCIRSCFELAHFTITLSSLIQISCTCFVVVNCGLLQMPYKRSPSPGQQQWQSNRGNYWSGQQKMPYHSPYIQNNNYNVSVCTVYQYIVV